MDKNSLIRVVIAAFALVNIILSGLGMPIIPEDTVNAASVLVGAIWVAWTMHKNNYLFRKGQKQKEVLEEEDLK